MPPIAVLGTYRSGSSAVAGVLHYLGVDMGAPFWGQHFESAELSQALRHWWSEPRLLPAMSAARRQVHLRAWLTGRQREAGLVGAKHPLLSLCGEDLLQAWGAEVRFVWCQRPLQDSIDSLQKQAWWAEAERIQRLLDNANCEFFREHSFVPIAFDELLEAPGAQIERLTAALGLKPTQMQLAAAVAWIENWSPADRSLPTPSFALQGSTQPSSREPKIVATMLGGDSESVVVAAVESVIDWVDELCFIDTGISDATLERVSASAKQKLYIASFPWIDDFSAARNAALTLALQRGATWALTIDTDERFEFKGYSNATELLTALDSQADVQAWSVPVKNGSYGKERFIRLPTALQWRGRTHETLSCDRGFVRKQLTGCYFWETGKSATARQHKLTRDLRMLLEETQTQPLNARWWYYLGQTYEGLKEYRLAVNAFDHCIRLDGWPDESAWACYTAARCLVALSEYREAEEYCGLGMTRKPTSAELPWLAGWCCFQRGAYQQAITWCKLAIVLGRDSQANSTTLFRHMPAWYEAPYDVLRHVFKQTGNSEAAAIAEQDFNIAKAHRLSLFS